MATLCMKHMSCMPLNPAMITLQVRLQIRTAVQWALCQAQKLRQPLSRARLTLKLAALLSKMVHSRRTTVQGQMILRPAQAFLTMSCPVWDGLAFC